MSNKSILKTCILLTVILIPVIIINFRNKAMANAKLQNQINSIVGYTFPIVDGKLETEAYKSSLEVYSVEGLKEISERYFESGNLKMESSFDSQGQLIKEIYYNENNQIDYELLYEYDVKRQMKTRTMFLGGDVFWVRTITEYDINGKIIKEKITDNKNELVRIDEFEYNDQDQLIRINRGKMGYTNFEYNSKNQLVEEVIANLSDSSLGNRISYRYDEHGRLDKTIRHNEDITRFEYTFY